MFKMFIKTVYLCNDVEAARMVIGTLKIEQQKAIAETAKCKMKGLSKRLVLIMIGRCQL